MYWGSTDLARGYPSLNKLDLPRCRDIESLEHVLESALKYIILTFSLCGVSETATGKQEDPDES
jgi:hypothetical protein